MYRYQSDYSNQVHQLMVSVSRHFFITRAGKYQYQKKPFNVELATRSAKRHAVHYLIRDHFSGLFYAELGDSECLTSIEEFLYRAWSKKLDHPFHGFPEAVSVPQTVRTAWPSVAASLAELGIPVIKVTSGFQGGIRDIRTWEEHLRCGLYESGFPPDYAEVKAKAPEMCRQLATWSFGGDSKEAKWRKNLKGGGLLVPSCKAFLQGTALSSNSSGREEA